MRRVAFFSPANVACALALLACGGVSAATAQESIGIAITIRNEVNGLLASRTFQINTGENVFRQESVTTGRDSSAKLVFKDNTNLSVGPETSVTLDRFVFAGATDYKKATLQLAKGVFRFITGSSDKRAYDIRTDVARIGVRGTIVDLLVETGRTIAVVQQGVVRACSISGPCTVLSQPGEAAVVTATSATNEGVGGGGGWSFASVCAGDSSLCEATRFASRQSPSRASTKITSSELSGSPNSAPSGSTARSTPSEQPPIAANNTGSGSEMVFASTAVLAVGVLADTISRAVGEKNTIPITTVNNVRPPPPPDGGGGETGASIAVALSPSIAAALSPSIASQTGIAAAQSSFVSTNSFLRLIFDFTGAEGGQQAATTAIGYAPQVSPEVARAYAAVTPKDRLFVKAPAAPGWTEPSWAFWGAAFGATTRLSGDALVGSHDVSSRVFGGAAGAEYLASPNAKIGLALAGGQTDYSLANNFGSGRSDYFQGALYGKTYLGAAYLTAAVASGVQWVKTNRTVVVGPELDALVASFTMPTLASRLEGGYRFGTAYAGVSPDGPAPSRRIRLTT